MRTLVTCPSHDAERQRMVHLIPNRGVKHGQHVCGEDRFKGMRPERTRRDSKAREDRPEHQKVPSHTNLHFSSNGAAMHHRASCLRGRKQDHCGNLDMCRPRGAVQDRVRHILGPQWGDVFIDLLRPLPISPETDHAELRFD